MAIAIWMAALLLYVVFRLWYDGLGKPLTAKQVEEYTQLLEQRAGLDAADLAVMSKFLGEDDGKDFISQAVCGHNESQIQNDANGHSVNLTESQLESMICQPEENRTRRDEPS